jgi:hypothetical protein
MNIKNKFDEEEGKLLFWVDGIVGGPIIYADTVEEGEAKVKELLVLGASINQMMEHIEMGKKIREYCEKYKGTPMYTEVMLGIQFGYNLRHE